MRMYDIIKKKRDGGVLTTEEIEFFVNGYTDGSIPDYQASALTMAIYFQGMDSRETVDLTLAMARSGDMMDLSPIEGETVDKHSTGGVGDKTTLIVAPIAAALGCKVAKMSGRGLGHTGGTVDKLEAIPGFRVELPPEMFFRQVGDIGISVIGQSGNLTPADKKLYALRDVTATVESTPLIAASIISKKLAGGSKNIVLDVKCGSGAFMKTPEDAEELAKVMVSIGNKADRKTTAVITNMDIPLGNNVGNILEVKEAIEILSGRGPDDLRELCITLAAIMYSSCTGAEICDAEKKVLEVIENGAALQKFADMVKYQGGDANLIFHPESFEHSKYAYEIKAKAEGYIEAMDTERIGIASVILGAGRVKKEDSIDHSAGIILHKKTGDIVKEGEALATLYTNRRETIASAEKLFLEALTVNIEKKEEPPLIYKIIS